MNSAEPGILLSASMPATRVLIVEDEAKLLSHLVAIVSAEQHSVFTCSTFKELEHLLSVKTSRFDVIILDRLLNGRDSAELLARIKESYPDARVIVLSAIDTAAEKASLLNGGADDYVAKPFDGQELLARINVLLRRAPRALSLGNIILQADSRSLAVNGRDIPLTNKEFLLLKTLMLVPGKIFPKNELYETVWEMSADVESNVVEATVNKLRRRLEEVGANVRISNARNAGYWIEV